MIRRKIAVAGVALSIVSLGVLTTESSAFAGHVHYVATPNGACHQVARGQTSIADDTHGGFHQFHDHVHIGATGEPLTDGDDHLGQGEAEVALYKQGPAPAVCDGD